MIPSISSLLNTTFEVTTQPSLTYEMNIDNEQIAGTISDLSAIKQSIYKILNTERYQNIIYSTNYGIELSDMYGEPIDWVCLELESRISDALTQDDRINSVDSFEFSTSKGKVGVNFVVNTIYGDVETETVVNY